jgi:hypothetical protein
MNASSTELGRVFASSTASSTFGKYGSSSSTRRNRSTTTNTKTATTATTLLRVPVTIGLQTDTQTEIISGLQEGDQVVTKKTTGVSASNASAPSITSLFRPQNQGRPAGSSASPRAQ